MKSPRIRAEEAQCSGLGLMPTHFRDNPACHQEWQMWTSVLDTPREDGYPICSEDSVARALGLEGVQKRPLFTANKS